MRLTEFKQALVERFQQVRESFRANADLSSEGILQGERYHQPKQNDQHDERGHGDLHPCVRISEQQGVGDGRHRADQQNQPEDTLNFAPTIENARTAGGREFIQIMKVFGKTSFLQLGLRLEDIER